MAVSAEHSKPFACYDTESSFWKAIPPRGSGTSAAYSSAWPCLGAMFGGLAFGIPPEVSAAARPPITGVRLLLPTPTATNPNDGESLESWLARRQQNLAKRINGNGQGTPLAIAVRLLPQRGQEP